jgi:DNA repair exonuclease SbcCD ATPase subunit
MTNSNDDDRLDECQETVEELKVENAELREAAESFGALAERLNQARRSEADVASERCPRCAANQHVQAIEPTAFGYDRHCNYCGNSWRSLDVLIG